ncbi:MAG: hypothetical protein ACTSUO_05220 [Candidatus Thorarchaeota archaeon]
MTTLTISQLDKWYRKKMKSESKEFVKLAEKSYKIIERALRDVDMMAKEIKEMGDEEDPDQAGTASRFAMKIREIVVNFDITKDITYASTESMQDDIQYLIQEIWGAGARWIRRMDKKMKNVIKQLDVFMKELGNEMKRIGKLLFEYSWIKDLERVATRISTLQDLTFGKESFEEQIRQIGFKIDQAKSEYDTAKKDYDAFTDESHVSDLLSLDEESDHITNLIRMKLNTLRKTVKKFTQADTGVRISPGGQIALKEYFEDPFVAIVQEADGYPKFLEGLTGLEQAITQGSLKIKDRLARRSCEEIELIRNGSLKELQEKAKAIEDMRTKYAGSDIYEKDKALSTTLQEAGKNLEYHQNDLLKIGDDIRRQIEKVEEFRERIEAEIKTAFKEKVIIQIGDLHLEPLLEKCKVK